jgi:hypothetical protein
MIHLIQNQLKIVRRVLQLQADYITTEDKTLQTTGEQGFKITTVKLIGELAISGIKQYSAKRNILCHGKWKENDKLKEINKVTDFSTYRNQYMRIYLEALPLQVIAKLKQIFSCTNKSVHAL